MSGVLVIRSSSENGSELTLLNNENSNGGEGPEAGYAKFEILFIENNYFG